jgi:hypothetical protein
LAPGQAFEEAVVRRAEVLAPGAQHHGGLAVDGDGAAGFAAEADAAVRVLRDAEVDVFAQVARSRPGNSRAMPWA